MTNDEWKTVEAELSLPYGCVKLLCDGTKVDLQVVKRAPLKYTICVYVDGWSKGCWCSPKETHPEQRFLRSLTYPAFSAATLKRMKPLYSAKQYRDMAAKKLHMFALDWPRFKPLMRHYKATFNTLQLVVPSKPQGGPAVSVLDALANDLKAIADDMHATNQALGIGAAPAAASAG